MQYNDLIYKSGPVNVKDYVLDKYNIVHNQLYTDALNNYIYDYSKKLIMNSIFYNLFWAMNNCITPFNDIETIIDLEELNRMKNGELYKVFQIEEIKNKNLVQPYYITALLNYTNDNLYQDKSDFNTALELLCINKEDRINYINYIIVNIISLLDDIKNNIINIEKIKTPKQQTFSDFIIRYRNSLYIADESDGLSLFNTEISNNEVFIYEEQYKLDYHIGFNEDGYFILDINENIDIKRNYEKLYYIMSYVNYLLLNLLLEKIIENYKKSNTILEKAQEEYYLPSSIIIYGKKYPHRKKYIDLTPYWSNYNDHSDINVEDIKIIGEQINDFEIKDINYVDGSMKMYSKLHDFNYIVNKKYINENTKIDDEFINNTFIQKI